MVGSSTFADQEVRVLDSDGVPLTTAMTRAVDDDGAVILAEVDDPGILLDYYFGRGERLVVMELPRRDACQDRRGNPGDLVAGRRATLAGVRGPPTRDTRPHRVTEPVAGRTVAGFPSGALLRDSRLPANARLPLY